MRVYYELDLGAFNAWSGAVSTLNRIRWEGLTGELERLLDELYPDGMSETELNDLLWFESDWIFGSLGISDEDEEDEEE